jgi:vitamin B12 transport system substrate-binding protein
VGVSSYSDFPLRRKNRAGCHLAGLNIERIVALKPDVVLAWRGGNAERQVDQLERLGIKVLWLDAVTIEQVAESLAELAHTPNKRSRHQLSCWPSSAEKTVCRADEKTGISAVWRRTAFHQR